MYVDIAALVREALLGNGCDPKLLANFDSHSTIALDFHDLPSIYISSQDEDIWFWSRIAEYDEAALQKCGYSLLKEHMEGEAFIRSQQFQFAQNEGYLEFKALLHPDSLQSAENFSKALEGYFERLERIIEVMH
ncbi:SPI-1 type III secretion system chaperone SpaK [Sodalis sp. C49]|uniref:InvB/SpaK family type III secretion system chaperone n=1 Tax=unclassified Sodalis (in: enterobacteria) TaxID=2636512 RepID=UPI003965A350